MAQEVAGSKPAGHPTSLVLEIRVECSFRREKRVTGRRGHDGDTHDSGSLESESVRLAEPVSKAVRRITSLGFESSALRSRGDHRHGALDDVVASHPQPRHGGKRSRDRLLPTGEGQYDNLAHGESTREAREPLAKRLGALPLGFESSALRLWWLNHNVDDWKGRKPGPAPFLGSAITTEGSPSWCQTTNVSARTLAGTQLGTTPGASARARCHLGESTREVREPS